MPDLRDDATMVADEPESDGGEGTGVPVDAKRHAEELATELSGMVLHDIYRGGMPASCGVIMGGIPGAQDASDRAKETTKLACEASLNAVKGVWTDFAEQYGLTKVDFSVTMGTEDNLLKSIGDKVLPAINGRIPRELISVIVSSSELEAMERLLSEQRAATKVDKRLDTEVNGFLRELLKNMQEKEHETLTDFLNALTTLTIVDDIGTESEATHAIPYADWMAATIADINAGRTYIVTQDRESEEYGNAIEFKSNVLGKLTGQDVEKIKVFLREHGNNPLYLALPGIAPFDANSFTVRAKAAAAVWRAL